MKNRYTIYSKIARKEGYEQIAEIFLVTADNERVHARVLFELIQELKEKSNKNKFSEIKVDSTTPTSFGTTAENLEAAANGEKYEYTQMYPSFAETAKKEDLQKISVKLLAIAKAEEHHEERYKKILEQVKTGTFFKKTKEKWWVCRECGYTHYGKEPPSKCPSCDHERGFYQIKCEEY